MLGFPIRDLQGMRIMMFQLSGFYFRCIEVPWRMFEAGWLNTKNSKLWERRNQHLGRSGSQRFIGFRASGRCGLGSKVRV